MQKELSCLVVLALRRRAFLVHRTNFNKSLLMQWDRLEASELELHWQEKRLLKHTLTSEEVDLVLTQSGIEADQGIRDWAMLEVLYSAGRCPKELLSLTKQDVNAGGGVLAVRQVKGRFVPVGERALLWIQKYLEEVRPRHAFVQP